MNANEERELHAAWCAVCRNIIARYVAPGMLNAAFSVAEKHMLEVMTAIGEKERDEIARHLAERLG